MIVGKKTSVHAMMIRANAMITNIFIPHAYVSKKAALLLFWEIISQGGEKGYGFCWGGI